MNNFPIVLLWFKDAETKRTRAKSIEIKVKQNEVHENQAFDGYESISNLRMTSTSHDQDVNNANNKVAGPSNGTVPKGKNSSVNERQQETAKQTKAGDDGIGASLMSLVRNRTFALFVVSIMFAAPAFSVQVLFLVDIYQDKGFTMDDAAFGLFIFNTINGVGRFAPGFLLKIPFMPILGVPITAYIFGITGVALTILADDKTMLILATSITGFGLGICVSSVAVTTADIVDVKHLSNGLGILLTSQGIGLAVSGPFNGMQS